MLSTQMDYAALHEENNYLHLLFKRIIIQCSYNFPIKNPALSVFVSIHLDSKVSDAVFLECHDHLPYHYSVGSVVAIVPGRLVRTSPQGRQG